MWHQLAILLLCAGLSAAIVDLTKVCEDLQIGEVVPNPFDCQAYVVCAAVPTLRYCESGLHFDSARKVCNWPEFANCQANADVDATEIVATTPSPFANTWLPSFMAIDTSSGQPTDPMSQYDPERIECVHFGAYFLPHGHNCRQYYICAYGHLHQHKCGPGTRWNYRRQQCELSSEAECYRKSAAETALDAIELTPYSTLPPDSPTTTICYTQTPGGTWHPTGSYHTATTEEATMPTTALTSTTTSATSSLGPSSTPRADTDNAVVLECPSNRQAYLPHPKDCSKYYICIVGRPVLTTCPPGLYWDQKAEFCELAKNVKCISN